MIIVNFSAFDESTPQADSHRRIVHVMDILGDYYIIFLR